MPRLAVAWISFTCALGAGLSAPAQPAQSAPAPPASPAVSPAAETPRFPAGTEVVSLDIVVRDKKGKLVTDLQPGEVEVLEDGVPQKITSFRALAETGGKPAGEAAGATAGGGAATTPAPAAGSPESRRVVLLFGRLSSDGRRLAQGAGEEFARKYVGPQAVVTVLRLDNGVIPILDAASDPAAVREGVRKATAIVGASAMPKGGPVGTDNSYAGQQLGRFTGGAGETELAQSESIAFLHGLFSVVEALQADQGRKTVIVFSEGFMVPPNQEQVFTDLLSRANRANVSFYGVDVRGLSLSTDLASSRAALASAVATSGLQRNPDNAATTREEMTQDDTAQTSMRSDVVDTLRQLSTGTGGFLATHTNDFGRPLARIAEDMRGYYQAAYAPQGTSAPGQFHRVEVRLARKDLRVQSRSGYYAIPPVSPNAAAALAALSTAQLPGDFEVHSRLYRFGRQGAGLFDCLLKLEASLAAAEFKPNPQGKLAGRMTLAGRVLDGAGRVVDTFGQDVALGGSPEQVQSARAQMLPMARRLRLAPGSYTVELVVRDAVGGKTSAQRVPLTVPSPEGELAMSSLVVVAAVDTADAKADATDPLRLGDRRIVPNLGHPVAAAPGATLPIYYVVYAKVGSKQAVTATTEVSREGKVVARGSSPLSPPDADGRISGLSPIPLQKLAPGTYQVKVGVSDGTQSVEETTTVTVVGS